MQATQYFLLTMTAILFVVAGITFIHDVWAELGYRRCQARGLDVTVPAPLRWRISVTLALLAWIPFLLALGIAVMPMHALQAIH
jgi:tetrahydromethanopterin S-methyltransferase subunit C